MVHEVKNGKSTRMSFSKIKEVIEMPDLIDIQKQSYEWFLKSGLKDVLSDASPITDFSGNLMLEFVDYRLEEQKIFFGDLPLMTDNGTFLINGAERVVISQLVRSPGVYFAAERDKAGKF